MGVFTMRNDDSDMKIMGDDYDLPEPKDDTQETAQLLQREKENGNLNRARQLGALMAEEVSAVEGDFPAVEPALLTQRRILLAFVVEVGFDAFLPNSILTETAQSVFYETLQKDAGAFYEDLQESGAFSFYFLCVREGRQVEEKVGETYASLCGRPKDEALAIEGRTLYERFIRRVQKFVDSMGFVGETL